MNEMIQFFVYDSVKIILLLFVMITAVGFLRTFISQERIKKALSGRRAGAANFSAALFGAVTPFCSCSSIPLFIGFLEAGVPLGVALSFLITSPLINMYLAALMLGFFGLRVMILYVISGLLIGTVGGFILGKLGLEKYIEQGIKGKSFKKREYDSWKGRLSFGTGEAVRIVRNLWLWILVGVGIGALIHNYVPQETVHNIVSLAGPLAVPIAVAVGVPMYGSCAAIVPIAVVLFNKGVPLGTALAFMMATAALSIPEAVILRRAMKPKLLGAFFLVTALAIVFTGYVFNLI